MFVESYHGTTSLFEESIIQKGLVPNSNKSYSSYEGNKENPCLRSLFGVYLTTNKDVARNAALHAIKVHGGYPIIIKTKIDLYECYADEDAIWPWLESSFEYLFKKVNCKNISSFCGYFDSCSTFECNSLVECYKKRVELFIGEPIDKREDYLFYAFEKTLDRIKTHDFYDNKKFSYEYMSNHKMWKKPKINKTKLECEVEYNNMLELISRKYLNSVFNVNMSTHTFRFPNIIKEFEFI
jgi:hypothetical protein